MMKEEFLKLPEGPPYCEYEKGEVIFMPSPHERHQRLLLRLASLLDSHVSANHLGQIWINLDVYLSEDLIYVPDIVYLSAAHLDLCSQTDGKIHGVSDLVVEILSPYGIARDRITKLNNYFVCGIPWYWIIDPETLTLEEYQAEANGYLRTASIEPGQIFRPKKFPSLEVNLQELTK